MADFDPSIDNEEQTPAEEPKKANRNRARKPGRPSKRTPETRDRLLRAAGLGFSSLEAIARAAGVSKDTLDRMREADPKLDEEINTAREAALDRIEAGVLMAAAEDPRIGLQILKVRRSAYNDRKVELTGANGGAIQHAVLSQLPEMSDEALAGAVKALEAVISGEKPEEEGTK